MALLVLQNAELNPMTLTPATSIPQMIDAAVLSHLARRRGECATVLLPASHPGADEGDRRLVLEGLFHSLTAPDANELRARIEAELVAHRLSGGGAGVAVVAGVGFLDLYQSPVRTAHMEQGPYPWVLPLLLEATAPQDFLVLGLSQKLLRLVHYLQGEATAVELPAETPTSLETFRHREDRGDQNMENRASAGSTPGTMGALRFGTLSEREDAHLHLEHFFARVDASVSPVLGKRPLLLIGLEEEVAAFRRVAKHCHLFVEQISHAGMRDLPLRDIAHLAHECALSRQRAAGLEALGKIREKADRRLALEGNEEVLEAARAGRVHLLCVPELAGESQGERAEWNAAALETLSHGGEVLVVANTPILAALLRY